MLETAHQSAARSNNSFLDAITTGDCLEVLTKIEDESIDLSVFSPPYDHLRDYQGHWSLDLHCLGQELLRVTKPGGVCAVVMGDSAKDYAKSLTTFRTAVDWCDHIGWRIFETCLYHRPGRPGPWWNTRFRLDHEYILIFFKGKRPKTFDKVPLLLPAKYARATSAGIDLQANGWTRRGRRWTVGPLKCRGTVWPYITSGSEHNRLKLGHPATMPDKLAEDLIRCFSLTGDIVLDPCVGSGTTAVMAARWKRRYIGIDVSTHYAQIARQRLRAETEN